MNQNKEWESQLRKDWKAEQNEEPAGVTWDYFADWFIKRFHLILSQSRKEVVEEYQKEMYQCLEEVAQYENGLVNKEDVKVWIYSLKDK